jgi:HlyD family secretion protein
LTASRSDTHTSPGHSPAAATWADAEAEAAAMSPAGRPRTRRRVWPYAVGGLAVAAACAVGTWALLRDAKPKGVLDADVPVAVVTRGALIVSVTESGEVAADKRKVIANETRFPVIIKSLVEEGTRVRKGDTIITFESKELTDELETKKLAVSTARSAHTQADELYQIDEKEMTNTVHKAEQAVDDAKADLVGYIEAAGPVSIADANDAIRTGKRDLALASEKLSFKLKVNHDKELNSPFSENEIEADKLSVEKLRVAVQKAVSTYQMLIKYDDPRQIQKLKTAGEDAKIALDKAKFTARSKLLTDDTDRQTKKVALDMASRQLAELEEEATKLVFKADDEGLVVYDTGGGNGWRANDVTVEVGAKITQRQQLMIIPDMTTLLIKTKVYEAIIDQVKIGLKAHVRLDARPDTPLMGKISKVGVLPDSQHRWLNPGVKIFKIDIHLDKDVPDLKPGMTAQVEIELDRLANVLSVPVAAVFTEQEKTYCYRPVNGLPVRTEVKIGRMNDTRVELTSGLAEGDKVLLSPPSSSQGKDKDAEKDKEKKVDANQPPPGPTAGPPRRAEAPDAKGGTGGKPAAGGR